MKPCPLEWERQKKTLMRHLKINRTELIGNPAALQSVAGFSTHVLKALSVGAKAVGVGRYYLYPLAAAGQAGVERALGLMQTEIERDMKLMGCTAINQLSRDNLRFR